MSQHKPNFSHFRLMTWFLLLIAFAVFQGRAEAEAGGINLSHDLVRLGIANENLAPNHPSFDARPIFQATLEYAKLHGTSFLTVDPGAYYFLTSQHPNAYLSFPALSNLTVDLAGSTVYFAGAFLQGFSLTDCQHVTLTNFIIDFLDQPFTYVQLAEVDATNRKFTYKVMPGWPDPATFTTPAGISAVPWVVVFRDGHILPGTSRMRIAQPIVGNVLSLVEAKTPWTQAATLATFRPGDTLVVTQRGGMPTVLVTRGDSITISHATIYGGSVMGVLLNTVSNSTVDRVCVMPRKGNLTSANADGIHFVDCGPNNHIRNCYVTGTLDDALVMDSYDIAATSDATPKGATQITVRRTAYDHFPNGTIVNFIDPNSANELAGATIVSQNPPDSNPPVFGGTVTLTFDKELPALARGSGMSFATPAQRGFGSSMENNRVGEVPFGRGIWIAGSKGVTITDNHIGSTSNGGIVVYEDNKSYPTPPSHDILIQHNVVEDSLGPMASGSGTQIAVGGIMVDSINATHAFVESSPNTNISILNNRILSSGRSGIWVGQVNGGTIRDNAVIRYDQHPELPLFGVSAAESSQLLLDFAQPIITRNDQNVSVSNNYVSR